ncbi:ATP-grasp domain-containing protein [Bacillus sp. JJ1532]|uniref:ATP-grasp domain-containing protein n=3 Tax=unclassified Bacillus (in: firmicutes) TaxID=185979 RepID=UPI002FFD828B
MLKPILTLHDIFGDGYIFNGRGSYHNSQWLPNSISQDSSSGSMLTLAGETPILCHKDVVDPLCLDIHKDAGLQVARNIYTYDNENSYYNLLNQLQKLNQKMILNYAHLPCEIDKEKYWIKTELLTYLNNKRYLGELVPKQYVPDRIILPISKLTINDKISFEFPFVVKAVTDQPSGGGFDIVICKNIEDLKQATQIFKSCQSIIIEKFLSIKKNYCVQFVQTHKGKMIYLGSAEQIISDEGKYSGNWIDADDQPPDAVIQIGKEIMEKAVSLGYWGVAGFDIVITEDNRIFVIDLNFRQNGSTGALLFMEQIMTSLSVKVLKLRKWKTNLGFDKFKKSVKPMVSGKMLIPLCIYNPTIQNPDNPIYLSSILVGNSKDEIKQIEGQMGKIGFK